MTVISDIGKTSPASPSGSRAWTPRLRILQVVEPGIDGVFRVVDLLTRSLLEEGHHLALAYSDCRSGPEQAYLVRTVTEAGEPCINLRINNAPQFNDLPAFGRLLQLCREFRPDVIHAHSSKAGALARLLFLAGVKARFVYTPHAYYGLAKKGGLRTAFFNLVEKQLGRIGTSLMSSTGERDFALHTLKISERRLSLALNAVDTDRFRPSDNRSEARTRLGLPENAIVLGWVGRLSFQKDPQTFYHAVAPILKRWPDLYILQAGRGEFSEELNQLANTLELSDRIVRHEHLAEPWTAYQAMDALIMTSRYEGLSLVLLEALASKLPLILSQVEGVTDLAPDALSHSWTAPSGDIPAFTNAIENWLADRSVPRECNHRSRAIETFSVKSWINRHMEVYLA